MPFDAELIPLLRDDLLDQLIDDYVSIFGMFNAAQLVNPGARDDIVRQMVCATLPLFLDRPDTRLIDGLMGRFITDVDDLSRHLDLHWPADGSLPVGELVIWLVAADYELAPAGPA